MISPAFAQTEGFFGFMNSVLVLVPNRLRISLMCQDLQVVMTYLYGARIFVVNLVVVLLARIHFSGFFRVARL